MTMALGPSHHTCMITSERKVECWGRNEEGQLGIGSTAQQDSPAEVPGAQTQFFSHQKSAARGDTDNFQVV